MSRSWRRFGKSLSHLQTQLLLKSLSSNFSLEKKIEHRIADLLWEEEKIVFEIQYSPISLEEVKSRCTDYQNFGYRSIWILYDGRFNQRKLTEAEDYLRKNVTTYYTDGKEFYDQFDVCDHLKRLYTGPRLLVDFLKLRNKELSPLLSRNWNASFEGDLYHWAEIHDIADLKKTERRCKKKIQWAQIYKFFLYRLLESVTK